MIQRAVNPRKVIASSAQRAPFEPINVIYASYEDNIDEINSRTRNIFDNLGKHIQPRSQAPPAAFSLQKICEARLAKRLIIDPLSAGFYGDENGKGMSYEISVYPT